MWQLWTCRATTHLTANPPPPLHPSPSPPSPPSPASLSATSASSSQQHTKVRSGPTMPVRRFSTARVTPLALPFERKRQTRVSPARDARHLLPWLLQHPPPPCQQITRLFRGCPKCCPPSKQKLEATSGATIGRATETSRDSGSGPQRSDPRPGFAEPQLQLTRATHRTGGKLPRLKVHLAAVRAGPGGRLLPGNRRRLKRQCHHKTETPAMPST